MHKKTHNTQPSKPPATARPGDTFGMDAGDKTPGGMAVGVLKEKATALLCSTMEAPTQPTTERADMTPDELITRVHRQRAELVAVELAMDTLMSVLTPEQQTKWLQALQSLQTMRTQTLLQSGADPSAIDHANKAIDKRIQRLEFARGQK